MTFSTESKNKEMAIGLIGVGVMGRCMLTRMQEAGYHVTAYDPFPAAQAFITEHHAILAPTPEHVAKSANIIIMSLPAPQHVLQTVDALLPSLTENHVLADTSTVSPQTSVDGAKRAAVMQAKYVDAPILGRPSAAGCWLMPAGGSEEAIARVTPPLSTCAKRVIRVGETGAGNTFKLLNQLMFSVINGVSAEVMVLTEVMGIDRKTFYDVITDSGAATVSGLFRETAGRIVDDRYDDPTFTIELLCKDAGLGLQMAKEAGASPLIAGFVQNLNENAKGIGLAKKDTSSLAAMFRNYYSGIGEIQ